MGMDSIEEVTLKSYDGRDAFLCIRTENFPHPFVFSCEMLTSSVFRKISCTEGWCLITHDCETEDSLHSTEMKETLAHPSFPRSVRPDLEYPTQAYHHMIKPTSSDRADKNLAEPWPSPWP